MTRKPVSWNQVTSAIQSGEVSDALERTRLSAFIGRELAKYVKAGNTARVSKAEAVKAAFLKAFPGGTRGRKAGQAGGELDAIDLSDLGIDAV